MKQLDELEATRFETVIHEREAIKNLYGTNQIDNRDYAPSPKSSLTSSNSSASSRS